MSTNVEGKVVVITGASTLSRSSKPLSKIRDRGPYRPDRTP
jgi:hypothetical protein